jgi:hypothetical protein
VVADLDLAKNIMIKDFDCFAIRRKVFPENKYLRHNITDMDLAEWKVARAAMTPAFSSGKLKQVLYILVSIIIPFEYYTS